MHARIGEDATTGLGIDAHAVDTRTRDDAADDDERGNTSFDDGEMFASDAFAVLAVLANRTLEAILERGTRGDEAAGLLVTDGQVQHGAAVDSNGNITKGEPMIDPTINYALIGGGVLALAGGITMIIASGTTVRDDTGTAVGSLVRRSTFTF